MDIATKCQTHSKGLHYGREHIEREIYNEKGFSIGAELFEEIVRCKDCKHYNEWDNGTGSCQRSENSCFWFGVDFNDFCSFGERSEE